MAKRKPEKPGKKRAKPAARARVSDPSRQPPVSGDVSTPTPQALGAKGGKRRRLRTVANVRTFVAFVLRQLEDGTSDPAIARVMLYGAQILSGLIESGEFEQRLEALEQARDKKTEPEGVAVQ